MAELLAGTLLPLLFERLASPELLNIAKREKVGDLVKKWESKLSSISMLLKDAEDKAMRGDESVQRWLDEIRDMIYDIEDVVDEIVTEEGIRSRSLSTEAVGAAATGGGGSSFTSKVRSLFPRKQLMLDQHLRSKMDKIGDRLDSILELKKDLKLSYGFGPARQETRYSNSNRMTDSLPKPCVIGREEAESAILAKLLTKTDDQHLSVIPIVGLGGVGKTTLAQSVFNNPAVVEAFPKRGWVCISDNFNMVDIARGLLGSLGGNVDPTDDPNVQHNNLSEILAKEKFLIILDDYWNENYKNWERLYNLFSLGVKGSKVIVTTRHQHVASMMTSRQTFPLRGLSDDDCLSLLAYHAFGVSTFDSHPDLKPIGKKIAFRCRGLPLVAKALGGLLRGVSRNTSEWEGIWDSMNCNVPQGTDDVFLALKSTYIYLPTHLKKCFIFCAIFSKDQEFDRDELVLLWMAEGLVETRFEGQKKSMRDQGRQQFDELQNRSFFQRSFLNESRFVMHDLICDLAMSIAGAAYLNVQRGEFDDVNGIYLEKVRHISYFSKRNEVSARFGKCRLFKGLRTFLALPTVESLQNSIRGEVVEDLLQHLTSLRTLSLRGYGMIKVPDCISQLKHLRYLDVSGSRIRELPKSICNLYNLETLILKRCKGLIKLPSEIKRLVNLRCLDISETPLLKNMPLGLGDLKKLEVLPKFVVGGENEGTLTELKDLQYLQEELVISNLQNVGNAVDARDAKLKDKELLLSLILEWDANNDLNSEMENRERQVLDLLQPHPNIIHVGIVEYGGVSFPSWIEDPSFVNIQRIRLHNCQTAKQLPSLGFLPSLKEVEIKGMDSVSTVGLEFCGRNAIRPFQSLEVLKLSQMPSWEDWVFEDIDEPFPKLIELDLQDCPKLGGSFPPQLNVLVKLKVLDCPLLVIPNSVRLIPSLREIHMRCYGEERMLKIPASQSNRPGFALPHMQPQLQH